MLVVVDASALVAELLRERGRKLLTDTKLELAITDVQWSETQYELTRRLTILVERNQLSITTAEELLQTSLELAASNLILFEKTSYEHLEPKARRRIARDPNDWQSVALALALNTGIWTNDKDFFGCGVAT
ncbi:MAG: PIN domain-containing protein [Trueperaceae bacterium]